MLAVINIITTNWPLPFSSSQAVNSLSLTRYRVSVSKKVQVIHYKKLLKAQ